MKETSGLSLIKNSVITLFNSFFMMLFSWVISIWIARQLGPTDYGVFSLVLWLSSTVSWVIGMGLIHSVTKFVAEYKGQDNDRNVTPVVLYVLKIEIAVSLLSTVLLLALKTQIADYFFSPNESLFISIAALGLLPGMVTAIFSATIEGIQKFEYFILSNLIISPLSFLAKAAVLLSGKGITGLLYVMLFFSVINTIFYFLVLRHEGLFTKDQAVPLDKSIRRRIMQYNRSVIAILLCDKIVWDKSENFFLGRFCTSGEIAFYNLGFNVAQRFMSILPNTFWRVLFPAMSSYSGSGDHEKMRRLFFLSTRYLAFVTFPVGIGGMILAYQIIHFLYGHEYIGAQRVLQIVFATSIISTLSNPASAVLYGFEKHAFIYKFGAILAVMNIVLDIIIIKRFGATGAACCYGFTTILGSTGGLFYTCRLMKLQYPFVPVLKIMLSTIIMGTVMETIIMQNGEIPGFIISIAAGCLTYVVCALVLCTPEEEDYRLLQSVKNVSPRFLHGVVDGACGLLREFKSER